MKTALVLLLIALCMAPCSADRPDGFVSIFNGKDLTGWVVEGSPEGFTVIDGCMHSDGGKGGNWIRTARQYGNYVMRLEWMLSKTGNSGIFVRESSPAGRGFEVQLLAPWTPYRDDLHCTGSMYGFVAADPRPDETTLRWRKAEITCQWKHVKAAIDGVVTSEADYDKVESMKNLPLVGYVGMQDSHTGPGEWVKFRNIEIKDLDQDPTFVAGGLRSDDSVIRRAAFDAAVRLGPPMVVALLDMAEKGTDAQTHAARMALERIVLNAAAAATGSQAQEVSKALLSRVSSAASGGEVSRACAARLLGLVGCDDELTATALAKAFSAGGAVAEAVLDALQRLPGKHATQALIRMLSSARPENQPAVALALGARKDALALPALTELMESRSAGTRLAAISALGVLGSGKAIPALRRAAAGAPESVRITVVDALIAIMDARGQDDASRAEALRAARELAVTDGQKAAVGR